MAPKRAPDQRKRSNSPYGPLGYRTNSIIAAGQSTYCGVSAVIRSKVGDYRLAWFRCDSMHCRDCGVRVRAERTKLYALAIGSAEVVAYDVSRQAWTNLSLKLRRADADYLRVPTRAGCLVLATHGTGAPVADVIGWLESALARLVQGPRVSTSRRWALVRQKEETGWTLVGISRERPRAMERAAERTVGLDDAACLLHPDDPLAWGAFVNAVGLHLPSRRRIES